MPVMLIPILVAAIIIAVIVSIGLIAVKKNLHLWIGPYLSRRIRRAWTQSKAGDHKTIHILFCIVDHFEPITDGSTVEQERSRMQDWLERYPELAGRHRDSDGKPPQHTWFYPGENYRPEYLDNLVSLCRMGLGEIELHLHHGNDTTVSLREKINTAISNFSKHGALTTEGTPSRHAYGFIHGNMALDNSMNDPRLCGVNAEITVLKETGCYADFSMPTAPAVSQTRKVNSIYYAIDDPDEPKSHDCGVDVVAGHTMKNGLMIIQGPLALSWSTSSRRRVLPKIENGEIQGSNPPSAGRISKWVQQHVHVKGREEWVIVKVSCHGAEDRSRDVILGAVADEMYSCLEANYRDQTGYALHYVTARELYNIIKAAEEGLDGDPGKYRDHVIPRYITHSGPIPQGA